MGYRMANLKCMTCGYNLRAHKSDDQCPECETVVRLSLIHNADQSNRTVRRWLLLSMILWVPLLGLLNYAFAFENGVAIAGAVLWLLTALFATVAFLRVNGEPKDQVALLVVMLLSTLASVCGFVANLFVMIMKPMINA